MKNICVVMIIITGVLTDSSLYHKERISIVFLVVVIAVISLRKFIFREPDLINTR